MKRSLDFGLRGPLLFVLALAFCASSANYEILAQTRPDQIMGGGSIVYGDLKIEGDAVDGTFQVILYVGPSQFARQATGSGGRYRFNGLPNGEYTLVVEFENQVIYRNTLYLTNTRPTDVRHDIVLTGRAASSSRATTGTAMAYSRSAANQNLYDKALAAIAKKQLDEAIALLNQLVANDAKDFVASTELGTLYFKQEKFAEADKAYVQALEAKPTFILALLNLGKLRIAQKNFEGAIEVLGKAVVAEPNSADAQHYLGEAYLGAKKGSKALGPLNEALRLDPAGKADIHLRLAALYNGAGMKDKAVIEYEQFLAKRPDYPEKKKLLDYIAQNKKP